MEARRHGPWHDAGGPWGTSAGAAWGQQPALGGSSRGSAQGRSPRVALGADHHLAQILLTQVSQDGTARPQLAQDEVPARVCTGRQAGSRRVQGAQLWIRRASREGWRHGKGRKQEGNSGACMSASWGWLPAGKRWRAGADLCMAAGCTAASACGAARPRQAPAAVGVAAGQAQVGCRYGARRGPSRDVLFYARTCRGGCRRQGKRVSSGGLEQPGASLRRTTASLFAAPRLRRPQLPSPLVGWWRR